MSNKVNNDEISKYVREVGDKMAEIVDKAAKIKPYCISVHERVRFMKNQSEFFFISKLKNYETYNNERKQQVFASNSKSQIACNKS